VAKLTDKQRKKIIAESVNGSSIRALAAKYQVSTTTIQRVLKSDAELTQKVAQKKAENTASVLAFMDSKKNDVCGLIDKFLSAMGDDEKLAAATVNQLATAMGIVIDKYTANEAVNASSAKENNLFEAIDSIGEEDLNDLPEVQHSAEGDSDMVED
jgi:DNA-binding MurR/RpiR family transcriptional regulator